VEGKTEGRRKTHKGRFRDPRLAEPISETITENPLYTRVFSLPS
jgi:hypothetical protein